MLKTSFQNTIKTHTNLDIEALKILKFKLKTLKSVSCTTVDTYVFQYRNQTFSANDGSCSWKRDEKLLQAIG